MPRAFLITHRRYNTVVEYDNRESSPERSVSEAEHRRGSVDTDTAPSIPPRGQRSPTVHSLPRHSSRPFSLESAWTTVTSASAPRRHAHRRDTVENGNDCPEELYNLTKLAEVSLAAAAGHIFTPLGETPTRESSDADGLNDDDEDEDDGTRDEDDEDYSGSQRSNSPRQRNTASGGVIGEYHGCPECGKRYSTSSNLARHRQTHRSLADKKARRCPHCDKVYVSMPAFSMHVRTHNQGCKCPFCGKCFSRPWLLQGHIRTHTGEKPFRCSVCDKAFADKSNLRAHVQTHSNEKPYVCGRCGKAFALKSYLYKHEESSCMRIHHHGGGPAKSPPEDKESRSLSSGKKNPRLQPAVQEQPRKLDQAASNSVLTVIHRSEFGDVSVDDASYRASGRVFQVGGTESRENSPVSAVQYQEPVHQLRDDQQHVHHGTQHHRNLYVGRLHMMSPGITV